MLTFNTQQGWGGGYDSHVTHTSTPISLTHTHTRPCPQSNRNKNHKKVSLGEEHYKGYKSLS